MARTVIVTGSSSGIGLDLARALVERGDNVVLHGRDEEKLAKAVVQVGGDRQVVAVAGDVRQAKVGESLVRAAVDAFGRVDALVNSAGSFGAKPFVDVEESDLDEFLGGNLKGTFFTTQAAVRQMIAQGGGGSVVNIGTVFVDHALTGFPSSAPLVSKGAVHTLTTALAAELAPHQIRVNLIAPGIIRTPMHDPSAGETMGALHLLNRIGEVDETTAGILFLLDSSFTTGHVLRVDGGYVAGRS
ncbi:SDR family NAD(P)-dependent oxidoreductase [Nocardioides marmorisolisilvae]|uniref:SDR family oxidoreductase n=1 Tax=Nocardioides marmorisolisilvae TaxID=1542737 RepID=A0A3N0DSL5_9ACTN|nr:SDR family oxidoreductase [Nocardioides marmorisolisilvae]RNL78363.1 SDR family oxidoreductase [Nocardioides marmorisolisilvae]